MTDIKKQTCAVVGNPIEHSRSPAIHQSFAKQCGISLDYQKILATPEDFETRVRRFFEQGGIGLNITLPFKETAHALCDQLSDVAAACGSVNTLSMTQQGQLLGDTTDGAGLINDLKHKDISVFHDTIKEKIEKDVNRSEL